MKKLILAAAAFSLAPATHAQLQKITFEDPAGVIAAQPFGYSQVVSAPAGGQMLFISGQTSWDSKGNVIGEGDFKTQLAYCLKNIETILAAKGAKKSDIVKLNYYVKGLDEQKMYAVTEVAQQFFTGKTFPAGCLLGVAALADERFMVEVEATAIVLR